MQELLSKLLGAQLLSEETKKELEAAFKTQLDEAITAAKEETEADVRVQLNEQWLKERDELIEAIDSKVDEFLKTELKELHEDIDRYRDLEADYAEKLVEAKASMASELKGDLVELVEKLDTFLELRLQAEMQELHADLQEVRKNDFGRRVYEAFEEEFQNGYCDVESATATLRETEKRLTETMAALEESENRTADLERSIKLAKILKPLRGRQREVMEAILRNVDTKHLEEGYKTFIGRVIKEADESGNGEKTSEKEETVLAEGNDDSSTLKEKAVTKTGDTEEVITEGITSKADYSPLRKLAGIS
ncbi:MAG: hypothetical protein ACREAU_00345 [Nitrosopumilaceae archaeon]